MWTFELHRLFLSLGYRKMECKLSRYYLKILNNRLGLVFKCKFRSSIFFLIFLFTESGCPCYQTLFHAVIVENDLYFIIFKTIFFFLFEFIERINLWRVEETTWWGQRWSYFCHRGKTGAPFILWEKVVHLEVFNLFSIFCFGIDGILFF